MASHGAKQVHGDEHEYDELEPEVLTYSEFHRRRILKDWHERRRLYESGMRAAASTGTLAGVRHVVADWAQELASRSSGRSLFRRPA
jgi:hypothetical protein